MLMAAPDGFTGDGVLLVDKPAGVTSYAVVDHVRRALLTTYPELDPRRRGGPRRQRARFKCGHAGTLDPLATGLLLVLTGKASRLANFLLGQDKTYAATVRFGCATDSHDRDGEPVRQAPAPNGVEAVVAALEAFRGRISQVPPIYSALKKDGQPLYKLARQGREVAEPEAREVTISRLELTGHRWGVTPSGPREQAINAFLPDDGCIYEVDLLVECSSGTYIRSLARDLARQAGSEGHIHELRRLGIGRFTVDEAVAGVLECDGVRLAEALRPAAAALPHLPTLPVTVDEAADLRQGRQPETTWLERLDGPPPVDEKQGQLFRMVDEAGRLVAVGRMDETTGQPVLALVVPQEKTRAIDPTDS